MAKVTIERWVVVAIALFTFSLGVSVGPIFMLVMKDYHQPGTWLGGASPVAAYSQTFGDLEISCDGMGEMRFERGEESFQLALSPTEQVIGIYKAADADLAFAYTQDYANGAYAAAIKKLILPADDEPLSTVNMKEILSNADLEAEMSGRIMDVWGASDDGSAVLLQVYSVVVTNQGLNSYDTSSWYWYDLESEALKPGKAPR